jgi:hypothetical protein
MNNEETKAKVEQLRCLIQEIIADRKELRLLRKENQWLRRELRKKNPRGDLLPPDARPTMKWLKQKLGLTNKQLADALNISCPLLYKIMQSRAKRIADAEGLTECINKRVTEFKTTGTIS